MRPERSIDAACKRRELPHLWGTWLHDCAPHSLEAPA
jgi:hypothetical protein